MDELKNLTWSYSSMNLFENCPYGFKLTYIDRKKRVSNIFAEIGSATHAVFEDYFNDEAEIFELEDLFRKKYEYYVKSPVPKNLLKFNYEDKTIELISKYFRTIEINRDNYEPLCIEGKAEYKIYNVSIVVKPDLIVRRKSDNKVILYDYKTSKYDKEKHSGYAYQCSLYKHIWEQVSGIHVDEMAIIYVKELTKKRGEEPKNGKIVPLEYDEKVMDRFLYDISSIIAERDWKPKLEQFQCENICSVRNSCRYKENTFGL